MAAAQPKAARLAGAWATAWPAHVWVHQVGRDQDSFFRFYAEQILPKLS